MVIYSNAKWPHGLPSLYISYAQDTVGAGCLACSARSEVGTRDTWVRLEHLVAAVTRRLKGAIGDQILQITMRRSIDELYADCVAIALVHRVSPRLS